MSIYTLLLLYIYSLFFHIYIYLYITSYCHFEVISYITILLSLKYKMLYYFSSTFALLSQKDIEIWLGILKLLKCSLLYDQ